jgi:hypothetical protein
MDDIGGRNLGNDPLRPVQSKILRHFPLLAYCLWQAYGHARLYPVRSIEPTDEFHSSAVNNMHWSRVLVVSNFLTNSMELSTSREIPSCLDT